VATSLRNPAAVNFQARGLSDAVDGTNVARGAMRALTNLVPDPTTRGNFLCRPAATDLIVLSETIPDAGFVSGFTVIGDTLYGMVASSLHAGHDQPFAYDLSVDPPVAIPVSGVTAANTPVSPPSTGKWVPPILAQVATRILVTHTGFPGDDIKFGWFDISGFEATITGNTIEQFAVIGDTVAGDPFIYGVPPGTPPSEAHIGFTVTGAGIPAGTTIVGVEDVAVASSGDLTAASAIVINIPDTADMYVGMIVQGVGIPPGTQILTVDSATQITLDQGATVTDAGAPFSAIGKEVEISNAATATANGAAFTFFSNTMITGNPNTFGMQPGLVLSGPGVATGTVIVSTVAVTAEIVASITAGDNNAFATVSASGLSDGMDVAGVGIPPGTTLLSAGGNLITLSNAALLTGTTTLFFSGTQIEVAPPLTGTNMGVELTVAGGTPEAPLWGAGDTQPNNLPEVPLGVVQMSGRAWFADGDSGVPFSDSLLPCVRTEDTQALLPANGMPVTAVAPIMLQNALVGGIVQAVIAFQEGKGMQQITGDPASNNLQMNLLPVLTGTLAPNSLAPSPLGLFFMSPEGLRLIDLQARVSDPIGQDGDGVVKPFLEVSNPPHDEPAPVSRICAAVNGRTLRIDTPRIDGSWSSYWFDITRKMWTGPHTGAASLCRQWRSDFLITPQARLGIFQEAPDEQHPRNCSFVENGRLLEYEWETSLLPDSGEMAENTIIESAIMVALQPDEQTQIDFLDEIRGPLDGVTLRGLNVPPALWGTAIFGWTLTGPDPGTIRQRQIPWTIPLVFKQGRVNIRGLSSKTITLGNFYMRYQVLGYLLQVPQIPAVTATDCLLSNAGVDLGSNLLTCLTPGPGMPPTLLVSNDGFTSLGSSGGAVLVNR